MYEDSCVLVTYRTTGFYYEIETVDALRVVCLCV